MTNTSLAQQRTARKRMLLALKEADERYRHEVMDEEERLVLKERIIPLKIRLARTAS